jgi:ankyrin repeat protein
MSQLILRKTVMKWSVIVSAIAVLAGTIIVGAFVLGWLCATPSSLVLENAAKNGDLELLRKHLRAHPDRVDYRYDANFLNGGQSLLHYACEGGDPAIVGFLLQSGADPNLKDNHGKTPIYSLLSNNANEQRLQCLDLLLNAGIDLHSQNDQSEDPLFLAAQMHSPEYVSRLLAAGAPLNQKEAKVGWTPLHMACVQDEKKHGILSVIRMLLEAGADSTVQDFSGRTPVDLALMKGNREVVRLFGDFRSRPGNRQ